jgi:outer membrane protein assembly factor BamB
MERVESRNSRSGGTMSPARRSLLAAVVVGAALAAVPVRPAGAQLADSAWPMFHHDVRHTGQSEYNGPATPDIKWIYKNKRRFISSPSIGPGGTIYYGTVKSVCANDPADGSNKWCVALTSTIKRSSPAIAADGTLYIGARDNRLYAVCTGVSCGVMPEGTILWRYKVHDDGDVRVSPAVGPDGTIYMAGTFAGEVHAVNPNGTMKWSYLLGNGIINASPAVAPNGNVYLGLLHALDSNGNLLWELDSSARNRSSAPSIATDGTVYVGSARGLYAVNPADGGEKWLFETTGRVTTTPAIANDGTIYVGTALRDQTLYALNPNGTVKWSFVTGDNFNASPIVGADGTIYAASGRTVHALNPDGTVLWEHETLGNIVASPAIGADGSLYICGGRYLYAFGN